MQPPTAPVTPADIRGIWPPWLLAWDDNWQLDEKSSMANLERVIDARPHGLYTLDTATEFYTMEFDEWLDIARRFVKTCEAMKAPFPIGLGCTWTGMQGALKRVEAARDLGVSLVHLAPPYWLPLNEDGLVRFYAGVNAVAGHLRVIVYAPPHGKVTLTGELYARLAKEAPCIAGSKTIGSDWSLMMSPQGAPHCHYAHEQRLVAAAKAGASGNCSSLAGVSVRFMTEWWDMIERGDFEAAERRQQNVEAFYQAAVQPIRDAGIMAGAIDKALAQVGGAIGSRKLRPPYPSVPDDMYRKLENEAKKLLESRPTH